MYLNVWKNVIKANFIMKLVQYLKKINAYQNVMKEILLFNINKYVSEFVLLLIIHIFMINQIQQYISKILVLKNVQVINLMFIKEDVLAAVLTILINIIMMEILIVFTNVHLDQRYMIIHV